MTPIFGLRNLRGLKNTAVDQMKLSWTKKNSKDHSRTQKTQKTTGHHLVGLRHLKRNQETERRLLWILSVL